MKATESGYEFILFSNKITSFYSVCFVTETPESMQRIFLILQFQWYNIKLNIHFIGLIMKKLDSVLNLFLLGWCSLICLFSISDSLAVDRVSGNERSFLDGCQL